MAKALAELKCDPCLPDALNQTSLYYAVREGHAEVIDWLISKGLNVNHVDTYGQTPIFYCIREGLVPTTEKLVSLGANWDVVDNNGQSPMFYVIKFNKQTMAEYLLSKGINLNIIDNKGSSLVSEAIKRKRTQLADLLIKSGAPAGEEEKKEKKVEKAKPKPVQEAAKEQKNERKIPKTYLLTKLNEAGQYEPVTDEEFEQFRRENPDIAKYFEVSNDDEDVAPLDELAVPDVPENAPIFDQWEKAASRLLMNLGRQPQAHIFAEPVDWERLQLPDYPLIIKKPMDFGTIKTKLKEHRYRGVREYMEDMELVFANCATYNAVGTDVAQLGIAVHGEYQRLVQQLYLNFYM